ncbi:MAG: DUF222 domain-containing protein [Microthrixaceae bacterium]
MVVELVFDGSERYVSAGEYNEFRDVLASVMGVRNAADGRLVDVTVEALANDYWQGSGIHTPVQWLVWRAGVTRATARRVITIAARAAELPTTLGLLRRGLLTLDQAHAVARYTPAEYEESVCNLAQCASVNQIIAATRTYNFDIENTGPKRPSKRGVSFGSDDDGTWWAQIRLAADEGAVVEAALGKVRDELHDLEREHAKKLAETEGRPTTGTDTELGVGDVGWADAVVGMANSILNRGANGAGTGARTGVHLHLELPEPGCRDSWIAELHGGARVPDWLRRQMTCDADIDITWTKDTTPFSYSRKHRTPPGRLRREIERRDRYQCRVPGCGTSRWLQAHHIIHWEDGCSTITENLAMMCPRHHRMHHHGLLGIAGNPDLPDSDPDGLKFTNQHGIPIEATGQPKPPQPDNFPAYQPYQSPTGERLQKRWVHFNKTDPPAADPAKADPPGSGPHQTSEPPGSRHHHPDPRETDGQTSDHPEHDRLKRQPAA